jgi:aspartyl-tRNA(Asn)/glutamyl-tRNA(Gln) amidotransferase subunit A
MIDLAARSATQLARAFADQTLSPVEVVKAVFARAAQCEPQWQALWLPDFEDALTQAVGAARASEARWRAGRPLSALDGVPITLKENIATSGMAVPLGSAATRLTPAVNDAPPAARLRQAGAVLWAKTTMPDFGMLTSGLSSFHKLTRNPWNLSKNPGGSSAGAAAAAAAGYGPIHIGTDIGGSIRLPAAWCGVVGFKPSAGRVPIYPPYTGRVAGPLTRTVADAAWVMATLSQADARDATSLPAQPIDWTDLPADASQAATCLKGLKIGLLMDAGWGLPVDAEIAAAVQNAARVFENAGAHLEPVAAFSTREMADGINLFWRVRSHLDIHALPPERQALVLPYILDWVAAGASATTAQLFHGFSQIASLRDAAVAAFHPRDQRRFDLLLSPVCPVHAGPAEHASPTNDPLRAMEHIGFTLPYNMGEQPALSVPCGFNADGLPMAVQVIGHRHDDMGVLRAGAAYECLRGPLPAWPQPPA